MRGHTAGTAVIGSDTDPVAAFVRNGFDDKRRPS